MEKQLTNHYALVVDMSGSMDSLSESVVKAFDGLIISLQKQSRSFDQETRVSVYLFNSMQVKVVAYDMDVLRMKSLKGQYRATAGTPLAKSTKQAIQDLEKIPDLYTDHSYLVYVFTDGEETLHDSSVEWLRDKLARLEENWTVVAQVPNQIGVRYMQDLGFSRGNIEIWNTSSSRGLEDAVEQFDAGTARYMTNRSKGIRGSSSYFQMDATKLNAQTVKSSLSPLSSRKFKLVQNPHATAIQIKPLVEASTGEPYILGNSYYGLVKNETIQPQKKVLVREKSTGKVFGPDGARGLVGLPDVGSVLARPTLSPEYDIYVQSTSVNRNVIPKQSVLVLR